MTGTIRQLSVRVSRKIGDGDFGSFGGEWEVTVNLPPDANLEEESQALFAFGKAFLGTELADIQASIKKSQPKELPREVATGGEPQIKTRPKEVNEGEEYDFICAKFVLEKTPEKKYKLSLFPKIGAGSGEYAEIKYTAKDWDAMWTVLVDLVAPEITEDLPVAKECEWLVHYKIGKEFTIQSGDRKGQKSHYRDLLAIRGM